MGCFICGGKPHPKDEWEEQYKDKDGNPIGMQIKCGTCGSEW